MRVTVLAVSGKVLRVIISPSVWALFYTITQGGAFNYACNKAV